MGDVSHLVKCLYHLEVGYNLKGSPQTLGTRISNQDKILSWNWRGVLSWPFLENTEDGIFSCNKERSLNKERKKKTLIRLICFLCNSFVSGFIGYFFWVICWHIFQTWGIFSWAIIEFCIPRISWAKSNTIVNLIWIVHNGIHYVFKHGSFNSCIFGISKVACLNN